MKTYNWIQKFRFLNKGYNNYFKNYNNFLNSSEN